MILMEIINFIINFNYFNYSIIINFIIINFNYSIYVNRKWIWPLNEVRVSQSPKTVQVVNKKE